MTEHSIQHEQTETNGAFFIEIEGKRIAKMDYSREGQKKITITYTEVGKSLRGTGAGRKLVEASVKWARENTITIALDCPFVIAQFKRHSEWADVLS